MRLHIEKPTLLLDKQRAVRNIERMAAKAQKSGVRFRPHFKTHRSAAIGEWFREFNVSAIAVSSVDMALYFGWHGWNDITIAFPANILQIGKINELAARVRLGLLLESPEVIQFLDQKLTAKVDAWIKVDAGYGRTGIAWDQSEALLDLARTIAQSRHLTARGILAHSGHSYHAGSKQQIESIYQVSVSRVSSVRDLLESQGSPRLDLSLGDTPTCSLVDDFSALEEITPGNFVFYDLKQLQIGSCVEDQIAVAVACPVVARHPERNELVLYGGSVHLSKDSFTRPDGKQVFGGVCLPEGQGWGSMLPDTYVSSLSQEHGVVRTTAEILSRVRVGDVLVVLPVHSCLVPSLLTEYHTLDGQALSSESSFGPAI